MKPFDIGLAKQGKPVCTRDGRKARIICFDCKDQHYPIVALIECDDTEVVQNYSNKGEAIIGDEWDKDLMMLPEKKEGWVNVYRRNNRRFKYDCDDIVFNTKEEAMQYAHNEENYITTVKIEWKE